MGAVGQLGDQLIGVVLAVVHGLGQRPEVEAHAQVFQATPYGGGRRLRQQHRQATAHGLHQAHLEAAVGEVIGEFAADQAAAENGDLALALQGLAETAVIHQIVDREHLADGVAFQRRRPGVRAQGQHQTAVIQVIIGQQHTLFVGVDAGHMDAGAHRHVELLGHLLGGRHGQLIGGFFLGEAGGEHGLGVITPVVGGEHHHRRLFIQLAEFLDRVEAGQAGADDHDWIHGSVLFQISTISKSSLPTPQSGHTQSSGMSSHLVPGSMPSSGRPSSSS